MLLANRKLPKADGLVTLICLVLAWLAGLAVGAFLPRPWPFWLVCAALGALTVLLGRDERRWRLAGGLLIAASLGALRLTLATPAASPLEPYLDAPRVILTGTVAAAPDLRADRSELHLAVRSIAVEGQEQLLRTGILLRLPREIPYRYGDILRVTGDLHQPSARPGFDYHAYLARRGLQAIMERPQVERLGHRTDNPVQQLLAALGDRSASLVNTLWPPSEAPLMAGILLGRERSIPAPLLEAFNATGTRHIIAISGFNITLLAGWLAGVLVTLLNRRVAAPIVIACLFFYTGLVGADPPVLRAALMAACTLGAFLFGRPADARNGLALSSFLKLGGSATNRTYKTGIPSAATSPVGSNICLPVLDNIGKKLAAFGIIHNSPHRHVNGQIFTVPPGSVATAAYSSLLCLVVTFVLEI